MKYFDNIPFLNLDYFFNLIYQVFFFIPELLINAVVFWFNFFTGGAIKTIFGVITIVASGVFFYSLYKIWLLLLAEWAAYEAIFVVEDAEKEEKKNINQEWVDIMGHIQSPNQSSWVMAIIECDKILDTLLRERGFEGKDLGEMLKSEKGKKLRSLQDAWEGHKIRNRIAHEAGYTLTNRDAKQATAHFELVFRELGFLD